MTVEEIEKRFQLLESQGTKIFSVTFKRKTDKIVDGNIVEPAGTLRTFKRCALGVKKGLKGVEVDPEIRRKQDRNNEVLTVWVFEEQGYRRINIPDVIEIRASGETIKFGD